MGADFSAGAKDPHKKKLFCTWRDMIGRALSSKYHDRKPTYRGGSVHENWKYLSNFVPWMEEHFPWNKWENGDTWELDKDVLVVRNKQYGPDTCCFLPQALNAIFSCYYANNTSGYAGINLRSDNQKWRVRVAENGERRYGTQRQFSHLSDAIEYWYELKQGIVERTVARYPDLPLHVRNALLTFLHRERAASMNENLMITG